MSGDNRHHDEPDKWCRHPHCRHTNWGGYDRLHTRGSECPPYDQNPPRNESAEFWEAVRKMARTP